MATAGQILTAVNTQGRFERVLLPAIVGIYAVGMPVWSFGRVLDGPHRPGEAVAAGLGHCMLGHAADVAARTGSPVDEAMLAQR